jgi:hypothetical protein
MTSGSQIRPVTNLADMPASLEKKMFEARARSQPRLSLRERAASSKSGQTLTRKTSNELAGILTMPHIRLQSAKSARKQKSGPRLTMPGTVFCFFSFRPLERRRTRRLAYAQLQPQPQLGAAQPQLASQPQPHEASQQQPLIARRALMRAKMQHLCLRQPQSQHESQQEASQPQAGAAQPQLGAAQPQLASQPQPQEASQQQECLARILAIRREKMQPHFCGQHESQHGAAQPQLGSAAQPQLGAASQPHPPLPKYAEASEALASAMATPRLSVDSTKRFIGRLLKKWG